MDGKSSLVKLNGDERGVAAIEFAIVLPFLLVVLIGIVCYGGYFWTAHAVQQMANDGARAAVAGLDDAERRSLAEASLQGAMTEYVYLAGSAAQVSVDSQGQRIAVRVAYDASDSVFWAMNEFVPMPSPTIRRQAVVRVGGY